MQHLYRHYNSNGTLLYVGISLSTLQRLGQHYQNAHWFDSISKVTIKNYKTKSQALNAEKKAIIKEGPLYNIQYNHDGYINIRRQQEQYLLLNREELIQQIRTTMKQLTNKTGIALSLSLWLADDDYDHSSDPYTISATSLLKPIKAIALARQNKDLVKVGDVESLIPSRMGTALHTAIEKSWGSENIHGLLESLGYPKDIIDRIQVNPPYDREPEPDDILVYMEKRSSKKIGKYTVSGKYDFILDGKLEDFKSTGVYNFISGSNKEKYMQQGSIYRWLNPEVITNDYMSIQYIFTDWSRMKAMQDKKYPQRRLVEQSLELMSIAATDQFIKGIISKIEQLEDAPQSAMPACTPDELWQKPDVFKYYKNPASKARSTKNFNNMADAQTRMAADGGVGVVDTFKGEVVRCRYCDVAGLCDQAQGYLNQGLLII